MLRDKLVCDLKSEHIQNKLLAQADLTFGKALSLAGAIETAYKDASELNAKASDVSKNVTLDKGCTVSERAVLQMPR